MYSSIEERWFYSTKIILLILLSIYIFFLIITYLLHFYQRVILLFHRLRSLYQNNGKVNSTLQTNMSESMLMESIMFELRLIQHLFEVYLARYLFIEYSNVGQELLICNQENPRLIPVRWWVIFFSDRNVRSIEIELICIKRNFCWLPSFSIYSVFLP